MTGVLPVPYYGYINQKRSAPDLESVPTARTTQGKTPSDEIMLTAIDQTNQVDHEIHSLLADKEAIAKILTYDSFGSIQYSASDIESVSYKGDILRFNLSLGRATMLSVSQLFHYWEKIKMNTPSESPTETEPTTEEIVNQAKTQGTAIWEHGCKLGYVAHFGGWFYAITEVLTPTGFKYSHSRHGSFYLAQSELIERSWEVEVA